MQQEDFGRLGDGVEREGSTTEPVARREAETGAHGLYASIKNRVREPARDIVSEDDYIAAQPAKGGKRGRSVGKESVPRTHRPSVVLENTAASSVPVSQAKAAQPGVLTGQSPRDPRSDFTPLAQQGETVASGTAREMPHADDFFGFGDMLVTPVGSGRYVEKGTRTEYLGAVFRGSVLVREVQAPTYLPPAPQGGGGVVVSRVNPYVSELQPTSLRDRVEAVLNSQNDRATTGEEVDLAIEAAESAGNEMIRTDDHLRGLALVDLRGEDVARMHITSTDHQSGTSHREFIVPSVRLDSLWPQIIRETVVVANGGSPSEIQLRRAVDSALAEVFGGICDQRWLRRDEHQGREYETLDRLRRELDRRVNDYAAHPVLPASKKDGFNCKEDQAVMGRALQVYLFFYGLTHFKATADEPFLRMVINDAVGKMINVKLKVTAARYYCYALEFAQLAFASMAAKVDPRFKKVSAQGLIPRYDNPYFRSNSGNGKFKPYYKAKGNDKLQKGRGNQSAGDRSGNGTA